MKTILRKVGKALDDYFLVGDIHRDVINTLGLIQEIDIPHKMAEKVRQKIRERYNIATLTTLGLDAVNTAVICAAMAQDRIPFEVIPIELLRLYVKKLNKDYSKELQNTILVGMRYDSMLEESIEINRGLQEINKGLRKIIVHYEKEIYKIREFYRRRRDNEGEDWKQ